MIEQNNKLPPLLLAIAVFLVYYVSNPLPGNYYDYTFRIAGAFLDGRLGLEETPPSWLNEVIPHEGKFYSAFPLGSVVTMLPLAVLKKFGVIEHFPGTFLAAAIASIVTLLLYQLSGRYLVSVTRRVVLALFPVLGSWMWANLAFAGSWHLALGLAVAGQLGTLYFILIRFHPFAAGCCFALAFGNRTEIVLVAPIFFYLIYRHGLNAAGNHWQAIDRFLAAPVLLGVLTLLYNYARFGSLFDFGYARIPGVLDEPWYQHGIFSIYAIPNNAYAMLIEPWRRIDEFPYLIPYGFGGSILLSCPFLLLLVRLGARDATLKLLAWSAIGILTLVLWCHGNTGGWQISYRYAMELLPWMFLIMLESSPKGVKPWEVILLVLSVLINAYSTYLFLRTEII